MSDQAISNRLAEKGLVLPRHTSPKHPYRPFRRAEETLYFSGKTAMRDGVVAYSGPVEDSTLELGKEAARLCAINLLGTIEDTIGLENLVSILKLTVFVNSRADFSNHPEVANAASLLLIDVLGEAGEHARSAVGVSSLPGNSSVEIEAIVSCRMEGNRG